VYIEFSSPEVLSDGRDRSVIRFFLPPKVGQPRVHDLRYRAEHPAAHVCVLWGADRSQHMIAVLAALYLRNREMLEQLVAVRQERGHVEFWCRSEEYRQELRRALEDAVDEVLWQRGRWKVGPGQVVPCTGTVVDWQSLPEDGSTLGAIRSAAKGQGLGLINPHGVL
jgi:hypothetical protein